jgi:sialate O-acetylesterase
MLHEIFNLAVALCFISVLYKVNSEKNASSIADLDTIDQLRRMMLQLNNKSKRRNTSSGIGNEFVAKTLGSNMVLQQNTPTYVYGFSTSQNNPIKLSFLDVTYTTVSSSTAAIDGGYYWQIDLPPISGGFKSYTIQIESSTGESAVLNNIVFGEVFLCSGQSNMQLALVSDMNSTAEINDADNYPFIRIFANALDYSMDPPVNPMDDISYAMLPWAVGSRRTVNDTAYTFFSAVCYLSGKNIFLNQLESKIPVGLVSSSWGGTVIEAWSPLEVINECNGTMGYPTVSSFDPNQWSGLYNSMIAPFKRMKFRAVIWYQGESNVGEENQYPCMFIGMMQSWQTLFQEKMPFIYVQIATWDNNGTPSIANFRYKQAQILSQASSSEVAMVTAADLGDPESPYEDIHPRYKSEVGRRVALAADSLLYNNHVPHMGPLLETFHVNESSNSITLKFTDNSCGVNGLQLHTPQECPRKEICGFTSLVFYRFEGRNRLYREIPASITVLSNAIQISPKEAPDFGFDLKQVKYGQNDYPMMTIYNSLGVPLLPFILDV